MSDGQKTRRKDDYLGTSEQVTTSGNNGDGILLNRGRGGVASVTNVFKQDRIQGRTGKGGDRVWHTGTSGLYGNIFVLFEIDSSVLFERVIWLSIKLFFEPRVALANDVLSITPSAKAVASSLTSSGTIGPSRFVPSRVSAWSTGGPV